MNLTRHMSYAIAFAFYVLGLTFSSYFLYVAVYFFVLGLTPPGRSHS